MDLVQTKEQRLLTRSQRMLAQVGANVPKCPEDRREKADKENVLADEWDDGRVSPFSPSEHAFLTDLPSPKPNLARLKSLVPDYSPSSSAKSNLTQTTDRNGSVSSRASLQHLMPNDDCTLPVRKRKLLDNLVVMGEIEEKVASPSTTLIRDVLSAPNSGTGEKNQEKDKRAVTNAVKVFDSAPEPTALLEKNEESKIRMTTKTTSKIPVTTSKEECLNVGEMEKELPTTLPMFSKNGQLKRAKVQQSMPKPVRVFNSTPDPAIPAASNDLSKSVLRKANGRKTANTAIKRTNVNSQFIQPRTVTSLSHKRPNQGDKQDEFSDSKGDRLTVANTQPLTEPKDRAVKNVSRNLFGLCDDSDAASDDELFRNDDVDEDCDPSWIPDKEKNKEDDDDELASENEEQDANQSVPVNVPGGEHESDAGTQSDEVADDETEQETTDKTPQKIRKKQIKLEMQQKRSLGQEYKQINGKTVQARQRKPAHVCKAKKCHLLVTPEVGDALFNEYWGQGSYERKVSYICGKLTFSAPERNRKRKLDSDKNKEVVWQYFFTINGERHQVCKSTFLDTLGETDTFLRRCQAKMRETVSGIAPKERRGIATPQHAHTQDFKDLIRAHINKFPAYVSHYCRMQTKQKYLSSTLSVKTMHSKFLEENKDKNIECSYSAYYRIFRTMGLKFKEPPQDTCNKCDELKAKIKFSKSEEEENRLKTEHELHLGKAEEAYKLKRFYKNLSKQDKSVKCLVFDLEQVFATPNVSCGKAYYLRQLSTYNLNIVDCYTNDTYNYMWHEGEASRGACEIASCLFTHIMDEVDDEVTQLYLFSDCCSGQNRNSIVAAMFSVALETHASLKKIDHIFLIPGHTRMDSDAKHSRIEHQKQKSGLISVPSQWYEVVRKVGPSYKVKEMADSFINFPELLEKDGPLIMRDKLEDNSKMYWTKTHWFQYNKHSPGKVKVKSSFAVDSEFSEYSMIRGNGKKRKLPANWFSSLKHKEPVNAISQAKMNDLRDLLKYIPETHHQFYRSLKVDCAIQEDTDPDLPSDNEET